MNYKKNTVLGLLAACALSTTLSAFDTTPTISSPKDTSDKAMAATIIKGRVDPLNAAIEVWAISGSDSAKVGVNDGAFIIDAKPGIYKIVIVARVPYKDVIKDDVQVANGNTTDLGTIKLQQ